MRVGYLDCATCGVEVPRRSSAHRRCDPCARKQRAGLEKARREQLGEKHREWVRNYRASVDASHKREQNRRWDLKKNYGMTPEQYDAISAQQGGGCAICHQKCKTGRNLAVDHCHATGKVRGLLCADCNRALGMFADSPDRLSAAIDYLWRAWHVERESA